MARYRHVHAARVRLGIRVGPGRYQSIARRVKSGRYRSRTRAMRLQMGREGWWGRAPLSVSRVSLAHSIERLIEEFGDWNI